MRERHMSSFASALRMTIVAMALGIALLIAIAADAADDDHRLDDAWKAAVLDLEGVVTDKQYAAINSLAYHSAVARLCDGFELDTDKLSKAINEIVAQGVDQVDDDVNMARQAHVLITLGTSHGIFLAEGSLHRDQFCADAVAAKADPENTSFWK